MEIQLTKQIIAIVTLDKEKVYAGSAPVFVAEDEEEQQRIAMYITRITFGMVHDLGNGVLIIVKH
ncbi:MAG TPA: hypothetical protein GXZ32_06445 [Clostridiales bacterium]|nr:hypothetical protein [Clostridiales bacterium]